MFAIPPQSAVALGSASAAATINTTGVLGQRKPAAPPPTVPSRTLYVRNLNEAINHARTFVVSCNWGEQGSHNTGLTKALEKLLASFGPVLDLKVKRNVKHRGQAFVSYASQDLADKVKKELQGFELFGKAMDIQYARESAFAVSQVDGKLDAHKKKRETLKAERAKMMPKEAKKPRLSERSTEYIPPNAILFVQNIPSGIAEEALTALFSPYPGFKEVRMVPGKPDIAFVEYDSEISSVGPKKALHGHRVTPEVEIKVSFAKR